MTGSEKESLTLSTSTVTEGFRADLQSVLGDGVLSHSAERLDAYVTDTYWLALHAQAEGEPLGRPEVVACPKTEAEVAEAVRVAGEHGVPVVAWGGGSGTQGGSVPVHGGLVLDLTGLDRIIEIDERSYTVTCEAGVNGDRLEHELNARGLMLPHYPASSQWATVGGYVAARGSGVLSTRYGKIEVLLLSLRVVLASGELIETVPVPRHAVGPELTQLFVGSEGTLGIITQVTLQIVPLPAVRRFAT
ncbi:MAG: FAD-binding oxidoreductase, partial [Actinomycetota bacterium]|nr:FAD-binding oxidoreductase [Actinomycetota bacterium]